MSNRVQLLKHDYPSPPLAAQKCLAVFDTSEPWSAPLLRQIDPRRHYGQYLPDQRIALLRRRRSHTPTQLLVDFGAAEVQIELLAEGKPLLLGPWLWQARAGGRPLVAAGNWEETCWHSDTDVDYLELRLPLADGWKLERQMLLGRKDSCLLLADALIGPRDSDVPSTELHYSGTLPRANDLTFEAAGETREGWLRKSNRHLATVIPLSLPEWRSEFNHGDVSGADEALAYSVAAHGRNLFAPLWLDLTTVRAKRPITWRRLTVGEELMPVPRDAATGFRVQFGIEQWLVYRSLARRSNRTILGQNFSTEFACCRLLPTGTTEVLLEVQ